MNLSNVPFFISFFNIIYYNFLWVCSEIHLIQIKHYRKSYFTIRISKLHPYLCCSFTINWMYPYSWMHLFALALASITLHILQLLRLLSFPSHFFPPTFFPQSIGMLFVGILSVVVVVVLAKVWPQFVILKSFGNGSHIEFLFLSYR